MFKRFWRWLRQLFYPKKQKRLVEVTWFMPGLDAYKAVYDLDNKGDMETWKLNEELYPCQIKSLY